MGLAPQVSDFFDLIAPAFRPDDLARIHAAWSVADAAHSGQLRQSGEPYVTHPLAVARILFESLEADADALCAALLHDVVEDTNVAVGDIEGRFGPVVAHIVDGVSKLDDVRTTGSAGAKEATLRKLVVAGGRDWRVFAVKLCDRLHNMRTLGAVGRSKRRRVALETYLIFFPLARYVGFVGIARELQSLSLRWLHPWRWDVISRWCDYKRTVDGRRLSAVIPQSLWSKLVREGADVDDDRRIADEVMVQAFALLREDRAGRALFSLPTLHVHCSSVEDAYQRLSELHSRFAYVPGSFRSDAGEGVVSSKVLMDRRGLVADFLFWFPRATRDPWVRGANGEFAGGGDDFLAVAEGGDSTGEFTRVLRDLVNQDTVQVFSPKGKRLSLPRHSTGLDFAFSIHTDIGLRARSVRINGVIRECRTELVSGDIVEVLTGDDVVARPEWLSQLRSPRSRAKLRAWLRDASRREAVAFGRRLLIDASADFDFDAFFQSQDSKAVLLSFGATSVDELCRLIGIGQLSAYAVASKSKGVDMHDVIGGAAGMDSHRQLVLDGRPSNGLKYCEKCMPIPGDQVVVLSTYSGAIVHRPACSALGAGRSSNEHFVPVWAGRMIEPLPVRVVIEATDRRGLLADCARVVADANVNVSAVLTKSFVDELTHHLAEMKFTVHVKSRATLVRCVEALRNVAGVTRVYRLAPELQSKTPTIESGREY